MPARTRTRRARVAVGAACLAWFGAAAIAGQSLPLYKATNSKPALLPIDSGASPYTGIGRYEGRTRCTAFLLATALPRQEHLNEAPAYALTSARCVASPGPEDVLVDQPGTGSITFNYFVDARHQVVTVPVSKIAYATMKGRDLAVLELSVLYRELVRQLIRPWPVPFTQRMVKDDQLVVVSASRAEDPKEDFLRLSTCKWEGMVPSVLEGAWRVFDMQYNECRISAAGSAGAPVLSVIDRNAVGMIVTTTMEAGGLPKCALGHPCEPDDGGGSRSRGKTNYATSLAGIGTCFDDRRRFNLNNPGCPLKQS